MNDREDRQNDNSAPSEERDVLDSTVEDLQEEVARIRAERDEYLAGWQRSKADYVNLSRRAREREAAQTSGSVAKMARSIIAVFDSLEAARAAAEEAGGTVLSGIEQVIKQLEAALKEHHVERFTPEPGDEFDPALHEPVQTVATDDENLDNTIAETLQSGYTAGDTVVRPARVSISKRG